MMFYQLCFYLALSWRVRLIICLCGKKEKKEKKEEGIFRAFTVRTVTRDWRHFSHYPKKENKKVRAKHTLLRWRFANL